MKTLALLLAFPLSLAPALAQPAPAATPEAGASAWLGIFLGDALDGGVQLIEVAPGGPAQKAGLHPGDVVIRLDGHEIADRTALRARLHDLKPGDRISLEVLRDGRSETHSIQATARTRPWQSLSVPPAPPAAGQNVLGARLAAIPPELRTHYGAPADSGVLVVEVERTASVLRVGDVIVRVNGRPVHDPETFDLATPLESLELVRDGKPRLLHRSDLAREQERRQLESTLEQLRRRVAELERRLESLEDTE